MTIRAAIYSRKSTLQAKGSKGQDSISIERQVDAATSYAAKQGWEVVHVFRDDAISGTEYVNRPAYNAMIAALGSFDRLIVWDQSRLGRDAGRTQIAVEDIEAEGVEIWTYGGERISMIEDADAMKVQMNGMMDGQAPRKARSIVRPIMRERAEKGLATGTQPFGYLIAVRDGQKVLAIYEPHAELVRHIFDLAASGAGIIKIAKKLSDEATSVKKWRAIGEGAAIKWSPTSVRDLLANPVYSGTVIYGKTRALRIKGENTRVRAEAGERISTDLPHLRIIAPEVWATVDAQREQRRGHYLRTHGGQLAGHPEGTLGSVGSKHLLTGMMRCGACGGALVIWAAAKQGAYRYAVCQKHRARGACANRIGVPLDKLTGAVIDGLRSQILTPERIDQLVRDLAAGAGESPEAKAAQQARVSAALRAVGGRLERLALVVADDGGDVPTLLKSIKVLEGQQGDLQAELDGLERAAVVSAEWSTVAHQEKVRAMLADWSGALAAGPVAGRQVLRKVLAGPIVVTSHKLPGSPAIHDYVVPGTFGRIIHGILDGDRATLVGTKTRARTAAVDLRRELSALAHSLPRPGVTGGRTS